jgi:hypothetical protein
MSKRDQPLSIKVSRQAIETLRRLDRKAVVAMRDVNLGRRGRHNFKGNIIDFIVLHGGAGMVEKKINEGDTDFLVDQEA